MFPMDPLEITDVFGVLPKPKDLELPAIQPWHFPFFRPTLGPGAGPVSGGGRRLSPQQPPGVIITVPPTQG
jgi:hypothetical protein